MHKMMMLRDNLVDELEKFADKPLNEQSLDLVDKLAHAIKCIDTVSAMERAENDGYSGRSYRDGMSRRTYRDDYSGDMPTVTATTRRRTDSWARWRI